MAIWPATLPAIDLDGFKLAPADQTVRSDMEVGRPRVRRRSAARNDKITCQWIFTDSEMGQFRAFYDEDLYGGAGWFTVDVPRGDGGVSTAVSIRFAGGWESELIGPLTWRVTATVEVY